MSTFVYLIVIIGIPALIFLGIGRLVRWRSMVVRGLVIVFSVIFGVGLFACATSSLGFGVYAFYFFEQGTICEDERGTPECTALIEREEQKFNTHLPTAVLWSLVPEILRPLCNEDSQAVCMANAYGMAFLGRWDAAIIGLAALIAAMIGMDRRKKKKQATAKLENDKPKNVEDVSSE